MEPSQRTEAEEAEERPVPPGGVAGTWASLLARLEARPRWHLAAFSLLLLALMGVLDEETGGELSFSIFYLVPVVFAVWFVGRRFALFVALLSAALWLHFEATTGPPYSNPWIPYWNAVVRLGFFTITLLLLHRVRLAGRRERDLARTDALTGVANGRAFRDRAAQALAAQRRSVRPLTIAYLDLDRFKEVNDRLGHSVGDEVLRTVAGAISARLRETDVVARLGGDEFGLLLPETDVQGATHVLAEVGAVVRQAGGGRWQVGVTIGAVTFLEAADSLDAMIQLADARMYEGKGAGRGTLRLASWSRASGIETVGAGAQAIA